MPGTDEIVVGDGAAAVFAALDRHRLGLRDRDEPYRGGLAAAAADADVEVPTVFPQRDRRAGVIGSLLSRRGFNRGAVAADRLGDAVDAGLRRIDVMIAARLRIAALALRVGGLRQRVVPAEIVPVVDR